MVFYSAHEQWRAIQLFGGAAEKGVQRFAGGTITQPGRAIFGGENQMDINGG